MNQAFELKGIKKSKIKTTVYKRPPKDVPKHDIIRVEATNEDGCKFIDCFIYPEEAMLIASALMRAWTVAYSLEKEDLKPK